jgi:predicted aspartyl protease
MNTKILLAAAIAFALGFALSEYRNLAAMHTQPIVNGRALIDNAVPIAQIESSATGAAVAPELMAAVSARAAHNPGRAERAPFSWQQVNQLVASADYLAAIQLLESRMGNPKEAARAWLLLATIYKKQGQAIAAVDAWFRYVKLELDTQKNEQARTDIQQYLLQLKTTPAMFNDNYTWLMAQFAELLKYRANDGELHLVMAALLMELKDDYQAQYHALMAVNDPLVQKRAEEILTKLKGSSVPDEVVIPLVRYGNQYLVATAIEGNPARLLLDTGASLSGLASHYTAKYPALLKAIKPIRLNTASGAQDSILFTVTHIEIGDLLFKQHILAQLPMDSSVEFDGLLGVDILGRFDFVIDQNAARLTLKPRKQ